MKRTYDNIINTEGAIKTNLSEQNIFINNSETKHTQILPLQLQISCGLGMGENVVGCRYVQGVDKETERGDYGERSCYE